MELRRDDLIAELEALRPAPRPDFAAELDARAAAGFPRAEGGNGSLSSRVAQALRPIRPGRLLAPAGATALAAIVVATAVVAISDDRPGTDRRLATTAGAGLPPTPRSANRESAPRSAGSGSSSSAAAGSALSGSALYTPRGRGREVERSTRIVLGADAAEVRVAAARVFSTVKSFGGIVLRSSVRNREGGGGGAAAAFDLLIPSGKLGEALAALSGIAEVRSRSDSTADVTAPTIGLEERLRDSRARVEGLLSQLAGADTDAERASVEARLRVERRRGAALRSRLSELRQRVHFARVSLRIESGAVGAAARENGDWGVGDALDDASRILTTAAGVTVIGLAILAPIALVLLLAALAHRIWTRRSRERILDRGET